MGDMLGQRVEIEITGVAHGGIFVARHEGRVVFVSDAIVGETVVAEITDDSKPTFWRADTVEVLSASDHRRDQIWPEAGLGRSPENRAGGAEFGHIDLPFQRELKRRVLTESLERMAGIVVDVDVEALPSGVGAPEDPHQPDETGAGWRTRVSLHVDEDGVVGPFAARSHRVIPVADLPLAVADLRRIAPHRAPAGRRTARDPDRVELVAPSTGDAFALGPDAPPTIVERVGDRRFTLSSGGFWQVHRHAATTLYAAVAGAVDADLVDPDAPNLDLYGGVGLFAAAIADRFGARTRITTVEADAAATGFAVGNLADLPRASAATGRVDQYLRRLMSGRESGAGSPARTATVVLDPPRSGAGKVVVRQLAQLGPAQLVYVACDPVALSRDAALLDAAGYELAALRAFDLFPNTHHVEAVATFVRRPSS